MDVSHNHDQHSPCEPLLKAGHPSRDDDAPAPGNKQATRVVWALNDPRV